MYTNLPFGVLYVMSLMQIIKMNTSYNVCWHCDCCFLFNRYTILSVYIIYIYLLFVRVLVESIIIMYSTPSSYRWLLWISESKNVQWMWCLRPFPAIYFIKLKITWIVCVCSRERNVCLLSPSYWFIVFNILCFGSDWVNGNQFEMFLYLWCRLPFCHIHHAYIQYTISINRFIYLHINILYNRLVR